MPYTCPYCKSEFFRQKNCIEHIRECGSRKVKAPEPPPVDPVTAWNVNENDRKFLRGVRISSDES